MSNANAKVSLLEGQIRDLTERLRVADAVREDAQRASQRYLDEKCAAEDTMDRMDRVIVAVKRWRDERLGGSNPAEHALVEAFDAYVEGITKS